MSDEQVERVAKIIYERGMRYLRLDVPEWTEGGNSLAQDEARAAAHEIIAAMQPTPQKGHDNRRCFVNCGLPADQCACFRQMQRAIAGEARHD